MRKRRIWISVTVGAVAFLRTAEELWFRTNLDLPGIVFFSVTAYFAGIVAAYAMAERFKIKRVPAKRQPVLVTLDREEWDGGEKTKYPA